MGCSQTAETSTKVPVQFAPWTLSPDLLPEDWLVPGWPRIHLVDEAFDAAHVAS